MKQNLKKGRENDMISKEERIRFFQRFQYCYFRTTYSIMDMALICGVSYNTIWCWLHEKTYPRRKHMRTLSTIFNVPYNWLRGRDDNGLYY